MSVSLIIFIVLHLLAFVFFIEALRRISHRNKEYPLEETSRTLPFGFFKLRYVVILYIIWRVRIFIKTRTR